MHDQCVKLMQLIQLGKISPYTSSVVIAELQYTLLKTYHQTKKTVIYYIEKALQLRNLSLIEIANTHKALSYYKNVNIKFGDCLIATQVPKGVTLCTYDTEFAKIPSLKIATPEEALKQLATT